MTLLNFYNYNENSLWHILLKEKYTTNSINKPIKNIHIYLKKYYTSLYFKQFKINFNNYQNNKLNHNNSEKYKCIIHSLLLDHAVCATLVDRPGEPRGGVLCVAKRI